MNATVNAVAKRYKYTGKERDEETGLYYHGARYYIPWLTRWTAVDPLDSKYAPESPYNYGHCNPIKWQDSTGMGPDDKKKETPQPTTGYREKHNEKGYTGEPITEPIPLEGVTVSAPAKNSNGIGYTMSGMPATLTTQSMPVSPYDLKGLEFREYLAAITPKGTGWIVQDADQLEKNSTWQGKVKSALIKFSHTDINGGVYNSGNNYVDFFSTPINSAVNLTQPQEYFRNANTPGKVFIGAVNMSMDVMAVYGTAKLSTPKFVAGELANTTAQFGDDLAFGLRTNLNEFSTATGYKNYRQFTSGGFQPDEILAAIENPSNRLHFNLTEFSRYRYSKFNPNTPITNGNITNWELYKIYNTPGALERTTFYKFVDGAYKVVPKPF